MVGFGYSSYGFSTAPFPSKWIESLMHSLESTFAEFKQEQLTVTRYPAMESLFELVDECFVRAALASFPVAHQIQLLAVASARLILRLNDELHQEQHPRIDEEYLSSYFATPLSLVLVVIEQYSPGKLNTEDALSLSELLKLPEGVDSIYGIRELSRAAFVNECLNPGLGIGSVRSRLAVLDEIAREHELGVQPSEGLDDALFMDQAIIDQVFKSFKLLLPRNKLWKYSDDMQARIQLPSLAVAFAKMQLPSDSLPSRIEFMRAAKESLMIKLATVVPQLRKVFRDPGQLAPIISRYEVSQLDDREEIVGGMAVVAEGEYRDRRVALKYVNLGIPKDAVRIEVETMFKARAATHSWYDSDARVVELIGSNVALNEEQFFLVMDFMPRGNVNQYLKRSQVPKHARYGMCRQIIATLACLHRSNIVHGDLKAANVLVDKDGNACLTDFGLADKAITGNRGLSYNSLNLTNRTEPWCAPERLSTGSTTRQADIWSYAMTVYEILTERQPYENMDHRTKIEAGILPPLPATLRTVGESDTAQLWEDNGLTDEVVSNVLVACCKKNPEDRPRAEDMVVAWDDIISRLHQPTRQNTVDPFEVANDVAGYLVEGSEIHTPQATHPLQSRTLEPPTRRASMQPKQGPVCSAVAHQIGHYQGGEEAETQRLVDSQFENNLMQTPEIAAIISENEPEPPTYQQDVEVQMRGLIHNAERLEKPLILHGCRTRLHHGHLTWDSNSRTLYAREQNALIGTGNIFSFPPNRPLRDATYRFTSKSSRPNQFEFIEISSMRRITIYSFSYNRHQQVISISSELFSCALAFGEVTDAERWWDWMERLCKHISSKLTKATETPTPPGREIASAFCSIEHVAHDRFFVLQGHVSWISERTTQEHIRAKNLNLPSSWRNFGLPPITVRSCRVTQRGGIAEDDGPVAAIIAIDASQWTDSEPATAVLSVEGSSYLCRFLTGDDPHADRQSDLIGVELYKLGSAQAAMSMLRQQALIFYEAAHGNSMMDQ